MHYIVKGNLLRAAALRDGDLSKECFLQQHRLEMQQPQSGTAKQYYTLLPFRMRSRPQDVLCGVMTAVWDRSFNRRLECFW